MTAVNDSGKTRHIGYEIASISNLMRRQGPGSLASCHGLTRMQNWIIGYLRRNEGTDVFQSDIERDFEITGATATNILKRMERDGLITREAISTDRRKKRIVLTERSVQISNEVLELFERNEKRMRQGLSEEELDVFFSVADRIRDNLQL